MDSLIDLNTGPDQPDDIDYGQPDLFDQHDLPERDEYSISSKPSVLHYREITQAMRQRTSMIGALQGLILGIILGGILFIIFLLMGLTDGDIHLGPVIVGLGLVIGGTSLACALIALSKLKMEHQEGYVEIDKNKIEYWTRKGINIIPLENTFGAGPDKEFTRPFLRICRLSDNKRGFDFTKQNFRNYEPVSGPARKLGSIDDDGNKYVRDTIILHVNERRKAGLPVAELPPFRFESVQKRREFLVLGDLQVVSYFRCDGKTMKYLLKGVEYDIPVAAVRKIKITKAQSQHGVTAWYAKLTLNPSSGYDELRVDILGLPHADDIDKYLRCLPTLFPEKKMDGYWN